MELTLTQIGLLMDIAGFILIFLFGGLSVGDPDQVVVGKAWKGVSWVRAAGFLLVIAGFTLQIFGATP